MRALSAASSGRLDKHHTTLSRAGSVSDQAVLALKAALEDKLFVDEKCVTLDGPYEKPWYKSSKHKLG